jgi:phage gpG-like protein
MAFTRSGPFLGKYGKEASGSITFTWVPHPSVFQRKIMQVEDDLSNRTAPLLISKSIISADIEENFRGQHDPEGQPWIDWSPSYAKNQVPYLRPSHSGDILNWQGRLRRAATSEKPFKVSNDSLFYNTGGLPPYWKYHQQPERSSGSRFGIIPNDPKKPNRTGRDEYVHLDQGIPQRRFLGLSEDAELLVLEVFDDWFQGVIEKASSSKGKTFARTRDPSRRRAPRQIID